MAGSFWAGFITHAGPIRAREINKSIIMKINTIICSALAVGLVGLFGGCASERGEGKASAAQLAAAAKVSKADAERIALARVPGGTIKEGELEKEKGRVIWSFDIATPGTREITEVQVDAMTGEVVGVDKESPADEAKEKQGEKEEDEK